MVLIMVLSFQAEELPLACFVRQSKWWAMLQFCLFGNGFFMVFIFSIRVDLPCSVLGMSYLSIFKGSIGGIGSWLVGFFFRTWSIFSHSLLFCKVYALKSADSIEGALLWLMASSGCFENSLIVPDIWQFDSPVSQSRFLIFFLLFEDVLSVCFVETPALFFYCSPDPMMTIITVILNHLSVNSYIPHFPFFLTLCIAVFT